MSREAAASAASASSVLVLLAGGCIAAIGAAGVCACAVAGFALNRSPTKPWNVACVAGALSGLVNKSTK